MLKKGESDFVRAVGDGCTVALRVHPGAKRNAITGVHDEALKISLTAPAIDGKANAALIGYLAEILGVPKAWVTLIQGIGSRVKTVRVIGLGPELVRERLSTKLEQVG
jgi:uncharacterized protein (TIGR00251 family)